jgi:hypothetical protein
MERRRSECSARSVPSVCRWGVTRVRGARIVTDHGRAGRWFATADHRCASPDQPTHLIRFQPGRSRLLWSVCVCPETMRRSSRRTRRPSPIDSVVSHVQSGMDSPGLRDRMADLAWRTARRAGLSRRASLRLCRRVLAGVPASDGTNRTPLGTSGCTPGAKRRARSEVLAALRTHLRPVVDLWVPKIHPCF